MPRQRRDAPGLRTSQLIYGRLLIWLPREMRRDFGSAMVQTFRDVYRGAFAAAGWKGVTGVWRRALLQVVATGIAERLGRFRAPPPRRCPSKRSSQRNNVMSHLWQDVRFALRSFRRKPGFTLTIVLIVALGIGATTTIFSVVDGVVLRPLPLPEPEELVYFTNGSHTGPDFRAWQDRVESLEQIAGNWTREMTLQDGGTPARINVAQVAGDFFGMFGATPLRGRLPDATDASRNTPVVALGHAFWLNRFGGDPNMLGRSVRLDGATYEVVGIMSPDFHGPRRITRGTVDAWKPIDLTMEQLQVPNIFVLQVAGRLRDGADITDAQREVDATLEILAQEYPSQYVRRDGTLRQVPLIPLHEAEVGSVRTPLLMLLGAVGMMLLIACANVANLFLARGLDRERELAVRAALGAGRGRLAGQLLTESVLLAVIGGVVGIVAAVAGVMGFVALAPAVIPRLDQVAVDPRVLAVAVLASVLTGVVFGLAPALYAARTDLQHALKDAGTRSSATRGHLRVKGALVVGEIAMALVLLVGGGLLFNSFVRLTMVSPGFTPERVFAVPVSPGVGTGGPFEQQIPPNFTSDVLDRLAAIPGVQRAAASVTVPFAENGRCCWSADAYTPTGKDSVRVMIHPVTPGFFETVGAALIHGRDFAYADDASDPAPTVISRSLVERFFPRGDAIGETITVGRGQPTDFLVIGVVNDMKFWSLSEDDDAKIFVPFHGHGDGFPFMNLALRMGGPTEGLANQIRQAIWSVDPNLAVPTVMALDEQISASITTPRFLSVLLLTFAGCAILLAVGGIYGTMLYTVVQRSHEMGIRLALGASTGQLLRYVLRNGVTLAALGLAIGLAGAFALSQVLTSFMFGITTQDLPTYSTVTVLLAVVAAAACYLPARRASRLDPISTLRAE